MRATHVLSMALISSASLCITPSLADDMLINAMKRIAELEAKNIALEVNHRRLEQSYKELEVSKKKLEQNLNTKDALSKKPGSKPLEKLAIKITRPATTSTVPAVLPEKTQEELGSIVLEGAYVGINGGYGGGVVNTVTDNYYWTTNSNSIRFGGPEIGKSNDFVRAGGGLVGGQLGYNYLFKNKFVIGAEIDFDWTAIGSQANYLSTGFSPPKGAFNNSSSGAGLNWISTERIRLGYVAGSFMPYITGGLAIVQSAYRSNLINLYSDTFISAGTTQGGTTNVGVGWSAGAGFEYSFLNNLSLKSEYLYTQTPGISVHNSSEFISSSNSGKIGFFADGSTANLDFHQVRVGLNYHPHFFDNPAPAVIAKY